MTVREFKTEVWLSLPPEAVFAFFSNATNLDATTPTGFSCACQGP